MKKTALIIFSILSVTLVAKASESASNDMAAAKQTKETPANISSVVIPVAPATPDVESDTKEAHVFFNYERGAERN